MISEARKGISHALLIQLVFRLNIFDISNNVIAEEKIQDVFPERSSCGLKRDDLWLRSGDRPGSFNYDAKNTAFIVSESYMDYRQEKKLYWN